MISSLVCCVLLSGGPVLKVRVDGDGYLRFARNGRVVYAAAASLSVAEGELVGPGGVAVLPAILVPSGAAGLSVDLQGNVSYRNGGSDVAAGRLVLALFPKNEALRLEDGFLVAA